MSSLPLLRYTGFTVSLNGLHWIYCAYSLLCYTGFIVLPLQGYTGFIVPLLYCASFTGLYWIWGRVDILPYRFRLRMRD